jgi:hypothetical protein
LDILHPIRFSAAVLFEDGTIESAWMLKALEYGCTLDPVSQLIRDIEKKRVCAICSSSISNGTEAASADSAAGSGVSIHQAGLLCKPVSLVMCDQFGVCHAPFAQARSLLSEHGYGYLTVLVHGEDGALHSPSVAELIPQPSGSHLVSNEAFMSCS